MLLIKALDQDDLDTGVFQYHEEDRPESYWNIDLGLVMGWNWNDNLERNFSQCAVAKLSTAIKVSKRKIRDQSTVVTSTNFVLFAEGFPALFIVQRDSRYKCTNKYNIVSRIIAHIVVFFKE